MLQSQRDTTTLCIRHTKPKPVERLFSQWDEDALREAMMPSHAPRKAKNADVMRENGAKGGTPARELAEKRRASILKLIKTKGPMRVAQIASQFPAFGYYQIQASVRSLRDSGLVRISPEGKRKWEVV